MWSSNRRQLAFVHVEGEKGQQVLPQGRWPAWRPASAHQPAALPASHSPHLGCGPERVGVGPEVDHVRVGCGGWSRGVHRVCAGRAKQGEGALPCLQAACRPFAGRLQAAFGPQWGEGCEE